LNEVKVMAKKRKKVNVDASGVADVRDASTNRPGVYQAKAGAAVSLGGGRAGNTVYMVDGVMVRDESRIDYDKDGEYEEVEVGGLAGRYGDETGGVREDKKAINNY
jgi:hypothetical protein